MATSEIMGCTQFLRHHAVCFQIGNEPTVRSILRYFFNERHALGLPTRIRASKIYGHSNALAENAVNRIRGLAATLMEQLQSRIGVKLNTSNGIMELGSQAQRMVPQSNQARQGSDSF